MKNMYFDVDAVRETLRKAPVPSIGVPFLESGEIDWQSLKNYVDFLVGSGAKALLLTPGDSHFAVLSHDEQLEFNRVVVDVCNHRAMVIGCESGMHHNRMVEFAEKYRDFGGDLLIPFAPEWVGHNSTENLIAYYKAAGKIVPTMLLSCNNGGLSFSVYDAVEKGDGIVAVKDDKPVPYGIEALPHIRDKMAFLSGGGMKFFLHVAPYGADAYLAVFSRCFPKIDKNFWQKYTAGDIKGAVEIAETYEDAFWKWCDDAGAHFDSGIRGMVEIAGFAKRYARKPFDHLNDEQFDSLRAFLKNKSII